MTRSHRIRDSIHTREIKFLNLEDPPERREAYGRVWIYKEIDMDV